MKKFSRLLGFLLVFAFLSCTSSDDNSSSKIVKKPSSLFVETSEGYSWTYQLYYSNNLITKITNSLGGTTEFKYDTSDRLLHLQGGSGRTSYYYTNGLLSSVEFKDNRDYTRTTYLFYNSLNQMNKSITNENDREYSNFYKYDTKDRLIESNDEFGNLEKYVYDNANNTFKNVYPQMGHRHNFGWIAPLINNVIMHDRLHSENLTYQYTYDSDNYPILVKEIGQNGEIYTSTAITYQQ